MFVASATIVPAAAQESAAPPAAPKSATSGKPKQPAAKYAAPRQTQAPRPESGPCIGVLSRLGENFTLRKVGITVFGNDENPVSIGAWHIDDLVAARIGAFVNRRAVVRRIAYPPGAFASLDTPQFLRNDDKAFEAIARPFLAGTHCARYVTVIPGRSTYPNTNQILRGLGILSPSGLVERFYVYAYAELRVYDESLNFVERKFISLDPAKDKRFLSSLTAGPLYGPHREVDKSYWPDPAGVIQNAMLRDATRDLVTRSLDATLPELKHVP